MIDQIEKLAFTRCGKTYRPVAYRERCLDSADNQFGDYTHNVLFATDDRTEFAFCCIKRDGGISFSSGPMEVLDAAKVKPQSYMKNGILVHHIGQRMITPEDVAKAL